MITADAYKTYLLSQGSNMSQIKINQANMVMNQTFTIDPTYKKVYILTKDGWKFEDAKYQKHSTPSILKDAVDYYLQFRPKVHYPIGTYVFVPDDTSFDINLSKAELEDPFSLPDDMISQLWFIVGRNVIGILNGYIMVSYISVGERIDPPIHIQVVNGQMKFQVHLTI